MDHKHAIVSVSQRSCVAAGGVNKLHMPTDYDQSSAMGSSRIKMMGMENGRLGRIRWGEKRSETHFHN